MKTIMDAVNHYKAEYPEKYDIGFIFCGSQIFKTEFNTLVLECMTNFGKSMTYPMYKSLISSGAIEVAHKPQPKEKESKVGYTSEEFWKDAPEDCNLAAISLTNKRDDYGLFVYESKEFDGYEYCSANRAGPSMEHHKIVKRPKPQLIFTKAMQEAGELKCGISAEIKGEERLVLLGPDSEGDYITKNREGIFEFNCINDFSYIDTRTDKEKACDDLIESYRVGVSDSAVKDACSIMMKAIQSGKIHGVKWVGK